MAHLAAAHVELPIMLSEIGSGSKGKSRAPDVNSPQSDRETDLEYMGMHSVVGREAGERDPLLLRDKVISDDAIEGLRQYVLI